jgi:hypothetical protein
MAGASWSSPGGSRSRRCGQGKSAADALFPRVVIPARCSLQQTGRPSSSLAAPSWPPGNAAAGLAVYGLVAVFPRRPGCPASRLRGAGGLGLQQEPLGGPSCRWGAASPSARGRPEAGGVGHVWVADANFRRPPGSLQLRLQRRGEMRMARAGGHASPPGQLRTSTAGRFRGPVWIMSATSR